MLQNLFLARQSKELEFLNLFSKSFILRRATFPALLMEPHTHTSLTEEDISLGFQRVHKIPPQKCGANRSAQVAHLPLR